MVPLSEVEKPGFARLMNKLVGNLVLKKRTFFTEKLSANFSNTKTRLIMALEKASFVSTTADLWTSRRRAFLGMTVHWVGEDLVRRSACLALRRVIGSHTFDVIAKVMDGVHKEFGISSKVNVTLTDNGSNFLKACRVFGSNATESPEVDHHEDNEEEEMAEFDEDMVYIDLFEIIGGQYERDSSVDSQSDEDIEISDTNPGRIKLPKHIRCSCHVLNLIATRDVDNISCAAFNKIKKRVDAKLQCIWNKQARSSLSSDYIMNKLGALFVLFNATRWNSFYDALKCVCDFIEAKNELLRETFQHFKIVPLTGAEEQFLLEYVRIMEPFTQALDVFQNEEAMSLGCVLPTILLLQDRMTLFSKDKSIKHCRALIGAISSSIETRFSPMFTDNHMRFASITDPHFKTVWLEDEDTDKLLLTNLLRSKVQRLSRQNETSQNSTDLQ
jgi:hypothetical protein